MSRVKIIIPARYSSTRLPGKPLKKILGKEMIIRVADICSKTLNKRDVIIATDNFLIKKTCENYNFKSVLTPKKCKTGTDRVFFAAKKIKSDFYVIIYPWAETLEFGQNKFNWSIFANEICAPNKCKVIDAIPDFKLYKKQNVNWSNELYFLNDEHFNEVGAYVLFQTVIKNIN